ncbi:pentapeptide repeat-containing protein [Luteococcus sp. OSA5]|uniref:pentapeptide repeat-containing protein n=1 Tax=Luteococcus sp. OSA5 TaxID=3401630 RepID=UPI003B427B48
MHLIPRPATEPRLAPDHVTLTPREELGPADVGDDDLVTDLHLSAIALPDHTSHYAELVSLRIDGGSLAGSRWYRTNWVDLALRQADAANTAFHESTLKRVTWQECRLVGLTLSGCTLTDVAHRDCLLSMANLRFANLNRVEFVGCDLRGADFTSARLTEVRFIDCLLDEANFTEARCDRVEINGGALAGLRGIDGLRGASIQVSDVLELAGPMARALGLELVTA